MIDSQAQIRWLAAAAALIVLVVGPVLAGSAIKTTTPVVTNFTIDDLRRSTPEMIEDAIADAGPHAIFLVLPEGNAECESGAKAACPRLDTDPVVVRMSTTVEDAAGTLEKIYPGLETTNATTAKWIQSKKTFGWPAAFTTVVLLLVGTLLTVALLTGRQPQRTGPVVRDPAPQPSYRPPAPLVRNAAPPPSPRQAAPPVLLLADLPGVRDVVREQGTTAKARSHVDGSGGYVALGDVLVWATPMGSGVAFPDDDVHVTVSVTPTLDGGSRP